MKAIKKKLASQLGDLPFNPLEYPLRYRLMDQLAGQLEWQPLGLEWYQRWWRAEDQLRNQLKGKHGIS